MKEGLAGAASWLFRKSCDLILAEPVFFRCVIHFPTYPQVTRLLPHSFKKKDWISFVQFNKVIQTQALFVFIGAGRRT